MDYFIASSGNYVGNTGELNSSAEQSSKEKQLEKQTIEWLKEYYKIDDETLISEYASRSMRLINIKTLFNFS